MRKNSNYTRGIMVIMMAAALFVLIVLSVEMDDPLRETFQIVFVAVLVSLLHTMVAQTGKEDVHVVPRLWKGTSCKGRGPVMVWTARDCRDMPAGQLQIVELFNSGTTAVTYLQFIVNEQKRNNTVYDIRDRINPGASLCIAFPKALDGGMRSLTLIHSWMGVDQSWTFDGELVEMDDHYLFTGPRRRGLYVNHRKNRMTPCVLRRLHPVRRNLGIQSPNPAQESPNPAE